MRRPAKSAIDLFEEAVYLLRSAPAPTLAAYYIGSLPCVLGFLFFWADMSQSAFAPDHCAPAALGLAILFCWMMYWQSMFVRRLRGELSGAAGQRWQKRESRRLGFLQIALQPTKLIVLPAAALCLLPFAGAYAIYQNLMAVNDAESANLSTAFGSARKQAFRWQSQSWTLLAILSLLNFVVFLNIGTAILLGPYLLKILLGVETVFTRSGVATMNTTFLAVAGGLTYLITNPLAKAVYLLRYYYAESVETGEDLRIKQALLPLLLVIFLPAMLKSQPAPPPAPTAAVSADQLNRAIDSVIHRPEYTWRLPRSIRPPQKSANWFVRTTESVVDGISSAANHVGSWLKRLMQWIGEKLKSVVPGLGGNQPGLESGKLRALLYTLLAGIAVVLIWLLWRIMRSRKQVRTKQAAGILAPAVELASEDLQADQQPLDEWLQLARDLLARDELRLALRAFYLAGLAYLAEKSMISIQRSKSNQDYLRELRRKGRTNPELVAVFDHNLNVFERTWYGMYDVDRGIVEQFESDFLKMRACAKQ